MERSLSPSALLSGREIGGRWLEAVLGRKLGTDVRINAWTVKSPDAREGFLSEIRFVKASYTTQDGTEDERDLVVKLLPETAEELQVVTAGRLAEREVQFYSYSGSEAFRTFFQRCGLDSPVPDVYWAGSTDDAVTIVLQDLTRRGYEHSVVPEGNSLAEMKCVLRSIATVHAAGVGNSQVCGLSALGDPFDPGHFEELVTAGLQKQAELFKGTQTASTLMSLRTFALEMIGTWQRHPLISTVVHGDLWTPNAVFSPDRTSARIFDWQFAHVGNPLADVATVLLCSGDPCVYKDHLLDVLGCYWESFHRALRGSGAAVDLSLEDVLDNLEKMWIHGFMVASAWTPCNLDNGKITEERVRAVVSFLEKKRVFADFLKTVQ